MDEAASYFTETFGRLDVLVNNAAAMPDFRVLSALETDMDAVRAALEVSVIGPWGLTQALLPLLTAAPAARIVNVSSLSAPAFPGLLDGQVHAQRPDHSARPGT